MIIISEYSNQLKKSAGVDYLKKMEDAARLLGIEVINFHQGNINSLDQALFYKKGLPLNEIVFWLGFVPELQYYQKVHHLLKKNSLNLIHSPSQFSKSEFFDQFYESIKEESIPSGIATDTQQAKQIAQQLGYPIFLKGTIQSLKKFGWENCVAKNEEELERIFDKLIIENSFSLGKIIVRKFIQLNYHEVGGNGIPKAHEYRFFILNKKLIDFSFYWNGENPFNLNIQRLEQLKNLALKTAQKVDVPFISVDIGETKNKEWKVIEIGDGQFSDIRNIPPLKFWNSVKNLV